MEINSDEEEKMENNEGREIEVYYEPAKRDSSSIIIGCM